MATYLIQCNNSKCRILNAKETKNIQKYVFECRKCGIRKRCYSKKNGTQITIRKVEDSQLAKEIVKEFNRELQIQQEGIMDLGFNVAG